MIAMPMFPLGSVLFPHMPLPLRVFENRYLVMLSRILEEEPAEFGVVLIERGQEVGGGEHRFSYGTVARIAHLEATDDFVVLVAEGRQRIAVSEWLADDPYPVATVTVLPELDWDDSLAGLRDEAERVVRRALAAAGDLDNDSWPPDVELSSDPVSACWQLAGVAPVGTMDQVAMLRCGSLEELLRAIIDNTTAAEETFPFRQ